MKQRVILFLLLWASTASQVCAQGMLQMLRRNDSLMTERYRRGNIDTMYIARPQTKWTITARINVSGATLEGEGIDAGQHFHAEMEANRKATLSMGISYLGLSLSAALNPAKLLGRYHDYELNFNSYGRSFGFDIIYQDAKNFTGWQDLPSRVGINEPFRCFL